jgi:aspartate carbamoyltransferase catalytic subunit
MSSEVSHLLDIGDLPDAGIDRILSGPRTTGADCVVALIFLSSSLRTRTGFAVAATRLGGTALSVVEARSGAEMSATESFADTLRVTAGMVDLVVVRTAAPLDRAMVRRLSPVPVVNGGDPGGEHPTQALIDLMAMQRFAGPISELHVGICGDLTMRATRSLLALLSRRPPARLTLIAPPVRQSHGVVLSAALQDRTEIRDVADLTGLDVLLLTGLAPGPNGELSATKRGLYALNTEGAGSLPSTAIVLSPGPVIDEISPDVRGDPRLRVFEHSDLGVQVRMAVLQYLLGHGD